MLLESNEFLLTEGLREVNRLRAKYGREPLEGLPKARRADSFRSCLLGVSLGDPDLAYDVCAGEFTVVPDPCPHASYHGYITAACKKRPRMEPFNPVLHRLERRFEEGHLSDLVLS